MAIGPAKHCPVCLNKSDVETEYIVSDRDERRIVCPRCGTYRIGNMLYEAPNLLEGKRHLLSGFLR